MSDGLRKIVFLTGTRADFGKLKPLMHTAQDDPSYVVHIFVTGMHMLANYGYTCEEVERAGFRNIYKYINQNASDGMDHILAKTIVGLSDYVREIKPDLIIVHGDRVEALAGATVGALNNILTAHIEGGEVSGTVDELIRHAVTKLSHIHLVSNEQARTRLIQLGERKDSIHVIGSPDVDVMNSNSLPSLQVVKKRYEIEYDSYGVMAFHPVTTERKDLQRQIAVIIDQLVKSQKNYVVIYPNNDYGTEVILEEYQRLSNNGRFRFFPSMRFEYFLSLLKHARFIVGNSSAGVREAPHFGVPTINLGSRQYNRVKCSSILDVSIDENAIARALEFVDTMSCIPNALFGTGDSAFRFHQILQCESFFSTPKQKYFVDYDTANQPETDYCSLLDKGSM
jgi:UDP-N-acetylglucosamine 2-epimerase (hydrolysing)